MPDPRPPLGLALLVLPVLVGCAVPPPDPESARSLAELAPVAEPLSITRDGGSELALTWRGRADQLLTVYAGPSPGSIDRAHPLAAGARSPVRFLDPAPGHRSYYEVETAAGERGMVAERKLPLEGAHNFRDLGGYRTVDGRRVRWGRLYRSDELSGLTEADLDYVSTLGIRLVCDFRGPAEREESPDRLPDSVVVVNPAIHDESMDPATLRRRILSGDLDDVDTVQLLVEGNRYFASRATAQYAEMFRHILAPGGLPALIHCTAGKDRAGFGAALLLLALGVPEETVRYDFLLTNVYTARRTAQRLRWIRVLSLFRTDLERVRPLMEVRPAYLDAALEVISTRYAGLEAYLQQVLGLGAADRERLRALLLE